MPGYLYILISIKNGSYYIGCSKNVEERLRQHNSGTVKATKYKHPYRLVFKQKFNSIGEAFKAEQKIKGWKRRDYIDKIVKSGNFFIHHMPS